MTKLGVSKLMQSTSRCDTEVAPHVLIATEIQLLHRSGAWLETLQWDHMSFLMNQNQQGWHLEAIIIMAFIYGTTELLSENCQNKRFKTTTNHRLCVTVSCKHSSMDQERVKLTSSGFSLVIRAAMTCPRGEGAVDRPSKSMRQSPQGWTP